MSRDDPVHKMNQADPMNGIQEKNNKSSMAVKVNIVNNLAHFGKN